LILTAAFGATVAGGCSNTNVSAEPVIQISLTAANTAPAVGATTTITATIVNDATSSGVTWEVYGGGTLSAATSTTVTYTAPASVAGSLTPVVIATSVADPLITSEVGLEIEGTPLITQPRIFPANANVAYSLTVSVDGGVAPYTWTQTAGTLPTGLTYTTSTSTEVAFSGTPTQVGTFPQSLEVADSTGATSSVNFNIVIEPQYTCLLNGSYVLQLTGYENTTYVPAVLSASITVSPAGVVSGFEDFGQPGASRFDVPIVGSCTTTSANYGLLTVAAGGFSSIYSFAVFDSLQAGRIEEIDSTGFNMTGRIEQQSSAAVSAAAPSGDFAFGFGGFNANNTHVGVAGQATLAADGSFATGRVDANGALSLVAAPVTGSLSATDASGRGTGSITLGGVTYPIIFYAQSPTSLYLMSAATATASPLLSGFATSQTAEPYSVASLAEPGILELWGVVPAATTTGPEPDTTLARFSNVNASSDTLDVFLNQTTRQPLTIELNPALSTSIIQDYPTAGITVDAGGRAVVSAPAATNSRGYVIYLSGPTTGYAVEEDGSTTGAYGYLEIQDPTPFASAPIGVFVSGTEIGLRQGPLTLLPQVTVGSTSMAASSISVTHAADLTTGRGTGEASTDYFGGTTVYYYIVNQNRIVMMGDGTSVGSAINFLQH
jgi:hypothetical protein